MRWDKMRDDLRSLWRALAAGATQVPRWRIVLTATAVVILVAVAALAPVPSAVQLRDWATSAGPWFPLAFLAAHVVVTVFPFPRTAFTLAAGLLFGTALGVTLAVLASTLSAVIALWLVRVAGWRLDRLVKNARVAAVDARLRQRGWPVVFSLRLIPAVPFSVINYLAGASSVRVVPYTLATVVGLTPGTLAVVVFGDAFTRHVNPWLIVVSAATACIGIVGLLYEYRAHRHDADAPTEPALRR